MESQDEINMWKLKDLIYTYGNLFVSIQSEDMKYVNELEKKDLITVKIENYGKICNPKK